MYYLLNLQYLARQQKQIFCTLLALCTFDLREGRLLRQCFQYRSVIFSNLDTAAHCTGRLEGQTFSIWFMAHIYDTILHTWISLSKIPYTTQYNTLECLSKNTQYDTLLHTWISLNTFEDGDQKSLSVDLEGGFEQFSAHCYGSAKCCLQDLDLTPRLWRITSSCS